MKILVTGAAGFIGSHVCRKLLSCGNRVLGIDNESDYYDPKLKQDRMAALEGWDHFSYRKQDILDRQALMDLCADVGPFDVVCHLAAQAGVRYSVEHPVVTTETNVVGFINVLTAIDTKKVVYASSSSVYGNGRIPSMLNNRTDHPCSIYAASKKCNEVMACAHEQMSAVECIGLRFFSVYGPFGRPDMVAFKFLDAMLRQEPVVLYNNGDMCRDWTYIDDVVSAIISAIEQEKKCEIYNVGTGESKTLHDIVAALERASGLTADIRFEPGVKDGDVQNTCADIYDTTRLLGYKPKTTLEEGIKYFVEWHKKYYAEKWGD